MNPEILIRVRIADQTERTLRSIEDRFRRLGVGTTQGAATRLAREERQQRTLELRERQQSFREQVQQETQLEAERRRNFQERQRRNRQQETEARRNFQETQRRARETRRDLERQRRLQDRLVRDQQRASRGATQLRSGFSGVVTSIADASFAMQSFADIIGRSFRAVVDVSAEFERLRLGLAAIQGSEIIADEQLARIRELADLPNITFTGGIRGVTSLVSAGASNPLAENLLREISNAVALSGGRADDLTESLRQFGQILSAGRFTQQDLRPILQRAPIIRRAFEREFGTFISGELNQVIERQGLTIEAALQRLVNQLSEGPRASAETFTNAVERLGDSIDDLLRDIGGSLLPTLRNLVNSLNDFVQFLRSPAGRVVQGGIGGAFAGGLAAVGSSLLTTGTIGAAAGGLFGGSRLGINVRDLSAQLRGTSGAERQAILTAENNRIRDLRNPLSNRLVSYGNVQGRTSGFANLVGRAVNPSRFNPFIAPTLSYLLGGAAIGAGAQLGISSVEQAGIGEGNALQNLISFIGGGEFNTSVIRLTENLRRLVEGGITPFNQVLTDTASNIISLTSSVRELSGDPTATAFDIPENIDLPGNREQAAEFIRTYDEVVNNIRSQRLNLQGQRESVESTIRTAATRLAAIGPRPEERGPGTPVPNEEERVNLERIIRESRADLQDINRREEQLAVALLRAQQTGQALRERAALYANIPDFSLEPRPDARYRFDRDVVDIPNFRRRTTGNFGQLGVRTTTGTTFFDQVAQSANNARNAIEEASEAFRRANEEVTARTARTGGALGGAPPPSGIRRIGIPGLISAEESPIDPDFTQVTLRVQKLREELGSLVGVEEDLDRIGASLASRSPFAFLEPQRNISDLINVGQRLQELRIRLTEVSETYSDLEGRAPFQELVGTPLRRVNEQIAELNEEITNLVNQRTGLNNVAASLNRIRNVVSRPVQRFGEQFRAFTGRFLQPERGRQGIVRDENNAIQAGRREFAFDAEQSIREGERLRGQLEQSIRNTGRSFYQEFGADFILDAIGIGGRSSDQLNDAFEDLQSRLEDSQEQVRQNQTLSYSQQLEELQNLNEQYERQKRELEERSERERQRAWRDWVKQQIIDIPLLIAEQTKLQLSARATNFILNSLGIGGDAIGSSATGAGVGSGLDLGRTGSAIGSIAGPAAVIAAGFTIAEFFKTGIPGDFLGGVVNTVSGESRLINETSQRMNNVNSEFSNLAGPSYIGKVEIGGKEVQEIEFVRMDLQSTGQLPDRP